MLLNDHLARTSSSLHSCLLLKESATDSFFLGDVFYDGEGKDLNFEKGKGKLFVCQLGMFFQLDFLAICLTNRTCNVGIGGVVLQLLIGRAVLCPILRDKLNRSILALEVLLSCSQ